MFSKIKCINKIESLTPYELTIEGTHCFFCNGMLKHNCRLTAHVDMEERTVKYLSRSGKEYTTLSNLTEHIFNVMEGKEGSWVLDGECCKTLPNGEDDFQGLMKEVTRKNYTIENPQYRIFDIVTEEEFNGEVESENFDKRYEMLCNLPKDENVKVLEQELITSQEIFDKWAGYVETYNWEGFMLRKNAPYKSGRTKDLLKYKPYFDDFEAVVEGVVTGKQTYAVAGEGNKEFDGVSALVIKHKGCDVRVGGGLTKEQRIEWFKDPSLIIGKTITIKYLEETQDKDGNWSLRHPTLKCVHGEERWT